MADRSSTPALHIGAMTLRGVDLGQETGAALARGVAMAMAQRLPAGSAIDAITVRVPASAVASGAGLDSDAIARSVALAVADAVAAPGAQTLGQAITTQGAHTNARQHAHTDRGDGRHG